MELIILIIDNFIELIILKYVFTGQQSKENDKKRFFLFCEKGSEESLHLYIMSIEAVENIKSN